MPPIYYNLWIQSVFAQLRVKYKYAYKYAVGASLILSIDLPRTISPQCVDTDDFLPPS